MHLWMRNLKMTTGLLQNNILKERNVSGLAQERVTEILQQLKGKKMTEDGKRRKKTIVERVLYQDTKTLLTLHFYTAGMPPLKQYVVLFQSKTPMAHLLNDKQEELFKQFLSNYVKQEEIVGKSGKQLKEMNLDSDEGQFLNVGDMFIGGQAKKIIHASAKNDKVVRAFQDCVSAGYILTGSYLQKKLPLDTVLQCISTLDPATPKHSTCLKRMKRLVELIPCGLTKDETSGYDAEVHRFQVDECLPAQDEKTNLDEWWAKIEQQGRYPAISKIALAVCTVFHGPLVESSFNTIGDIIGSKSANKTVNTYSSVQTIKYYLKTRRISAVQFFRKKEFLYDSVDRMLCANINSASNKYRADLKEKRLENEVKQKQLQLVLPVSKAHAKRKLEEDAEEAKMRHEDRQVKKARTRILSLSVVKRKNAALV